jgi:hypothetical protein
MSEDCAQLHRWLHDRPRLRFPFEAASIPRNGIYVLFESGETAHGGDRIVRIGTHTGQNQLRARLQQHFVLENKDRSIFRKNIGRALLAKAGDPFIEQWEFDLTGSKAREQQGHSVDHLKQGNVERKVSLYIQGHFTFVVLPIATKEQRLRLEARLISTLSLCDECVPSSEWLGNSSPKLKIKKSGLWQVNELHKEPCSPEDMKCLRACIFE